MVCVLDSSDYMFGGVQVCTWEFGFFMDFRGFHKHVKDEYAQLGKRNVYGREFEQRKMRVFFYK